MTEPVTLTARIDMLEAALICASRDESRLWWSGVYVDPAGFVVSTDGARLFAGDFTPDNSRNSLPAFDGWIIPRDALQRALKAAPKRAKDPAARVLEISPERVGDVVCQPIDSSFPDWRRVIPDEVTSDGTAAQFQGAHLADFDKIAAILSGARGQAFCTLHHNGDNPAPVTFGDSPAIGALMQRRDFNKRDTSAKHYRAVVDTFRA